MDNYQFSIIGFIILFLFIIPLYLYLKQGKHQRIALCIKGFGTTIPILFCLAAITTLKGEFYSNDQLNLLPEASFWILTGLLLCLVGDIVLSIHFVGGMGAFLLGHICYITAYCKLATLQLWSIALFLVLFLLVFSLFLTLIPKMGHNKIPFLLYGIVILVMLSIALMLPFSIGFIGILLALGAFLFVLSDFLLARNILVKVTILSDAISLYCYYAGLFFLAMSIYWYTFNFYH